MYVCQVWGRSDITQFFDDFFSHRTQVSDEPVRVWKRVKQLKV